MELAKLTLIKMMTGLLIPDSGSITMGGNDILKNPEATKKCLVMFLIHRVFSEKLKLTI